MPMFHWHCCCPDNLANDVVYAHHSTQFSNLNPTRLRSHAAYPRVIELSPTERKQILEHVRILVAKIAKLTQFLNRFTTTDTGQT